MMHGQKNIRHHWVSC